MKKRLKRFKDNLEGFTYIGKDDVYINIEMLWQQAVYELDVAELFAKKYMLVKYHEIIHHITALERKRINRLADKWDLGEECIIWKLQGCVMPEEKYDYYVKNLANKYTEVLPYEEWFG